MATAPEKRLASRLRRVGAERVAKAIVGWAARRANVGSRIVRRS
jgi:hypothetical protein